MSKTAEQADYTQPTQPLLQDAAELNSKSVPGEVVTEKTEMKEVEQETAHVTVITAYEQLPDVVAEDKAAEYTALPEPEPEPSAPHDSDSAEVTHIIPSADAHSLPEQVRSNEAPHQEMPVEEPEARKNNAPAPELATNKEGFVSETKEEPSEPTATTVIPKEKQPVPDSPVENTVAVETNEKQSESNALPTTFEEKQAVPDSPVANPVAGAILAEAEIAEPEQHVGTETTTAMPTVRDEQQPAVEVELPNPTFTRDSYQEQYPPPAEHLSETLVSWEN